MNVSNKAITLGVIADTHVPDKAARLHPDIPEIFHQAGVQEILHAGDISTPKVLHELTQIAPVRAVRGNRDLYLLSSLPRKLTLTYHDTTIGLTHGHGGLWSYFTGKFYYVYEGYQFTRYQKVVRGICPTEDVVVFGHSHMPENRWHDGILYFNPGAAGVLEAGYPQGIGLLHIEPGGKVHGELIQLERM